MHDKQVALVTGANRGIGLQIAKDLAAKGFTVLVGARSRERGEEAAKLVAGARALPLDVTDSKSIAAAAAWIQNELGRLDVLVNNAGIAHAGGRGKTLGEVVAKARPSVASLADARAVFETNVFGVLALTQALLPLLREAPAGRIVNVSSSAGSLTLNANPKAPFRQVFGATYSPSKTALNALTLAFAIELENTRIKVNAVCPGFVKTELNGFEGTKRVEDAARRAVALACLDANGPTGTFSNDEGPVPF